MTKIRSKSELKRVLIQNAATKLFSELGFAATTMDKIAKEAGVSKQTLYSHFKNKDVLFTEAISIECAAYKMVDLVNDKLDNPQQALTEIAYSFIEMLLSPDAVSLHRTCVAESITYPHVSRLFFEAGPQRMISELNKVMIELNRRGKLTIADTRIAAVQFLCLMKGEVKMQVDFNSESKLSASEVKAYIDSSVALFIRGYQL